MEKVKKEKNTTTEPRQVNDVKPKLTLKIYMGASLPGLASKTALSSGLPKKYKDNADIKAVCIDVNEVNSFIKNVNIEGSCENIRYRNTEKIAKELKNNGK